MAIIHQVALFYTKNTLFYKTNKALNKRWKAKKTRIQLGKSLILQNTINLLGLRAVSGERVQKTQLGSGSIKGVRIKIQYYSMYNKPGHNARTC